MFRSEITLRLRAGKKLKRVGANQGAVTIIGSLGTRKCQQRNAIAT
jgi:hypothetical protein